MRNKGLCVTVCSDLGDENHSVVDLLICYKVYYCRIDLLTPLNYGRTITGKEK
jgi:hypothetical protein